MTQREELKEMLKQKQLRKEVAKGKNQSNREKRGKVTSTKINCLDTSRGKVVFNKNTKGPVTRSDIRNISNQIMKEKNILRVSFAYLIV